MIEIYMSDNIVRCLVIGDTKSGKSSFIKRLISNNFDEIYLPTKYVEITKHFFNTDIGQIEVCFYDVSTQKLYTGYDLQFDCAIIVFELLEEVKYWKNQVKNICPKVPLMLCHNKIDVGTCNKLYQHIDVSVKNNRNVRFCFNQLLTKVFGLEIHTKM